MKTIGKVNIPGALHSITEDGIVACSNEIYDEDFGKFQSEINKRIMDSSGQCDKDSIIVRIPDEFNTEHAERIYSLIQNNGIDNSYIGKLQNDKLVHLEISEVDNGYALDYSTKLARVYVEITMSNGLYNAEKSYILYN